LDNQTHEDKSVSPQHTQNAKVYEVAPLKLQQFEKRLKFSLLDLLFYGLAIVEGYKFSFRKITQIEMEGLLRERPNIQ